MDFTATSGGGDGGSYERPKPGRYTGIIIGFADIGTHATQYGSKRKICLRWELHKRNGPAVDSQGNVHTIRAQYNRSFDIKSSFRKVIEAHIGKIKDGDQISSRRLLGTVAILTLDPSTDGRYVNVTSATAFDPEEDVLPKPMLSHEHWELTDTPPPPWWCKDRVDQCEERGGPKSDGSSADRTPTTRGSFDEF